MIPALVLAASMLAALAPARIAQAPKPISVSEGVAYASPADDDHKVDVYAPVSAHLAPVLVWFHGGGRETGSRKDIEKLGRALAGEGIVVVAPSYRLRSPASMKVDMRAICTDAARAIAWTQRNVALYGGNPKRIVVGGISAGAGIAALVVLDQRYLKAAGADPKRISGAFIMSGVLDNRPIPSDYPNPSMWRHDFGETDAQRWDVSPLKYVTANAPPMEISVAQQDNARFLTSADSFIAKMQSEGASVIKYTVLGNTHATEWGHAELAGDPLHQEIFRFVMTHAGGSGA
jgi:acetyl esterase/lipase